MNTLCSPVCYCCFSYHVRLNIFLNINLTIIDINYKYSIVLTCGNMLGNFEALMLLSTSFICRPLDVCCALLYYWPLPNVIFLLIAAGICLNFLCAWFLVISSVILDVIRKMRIMFATHCTFFTSFHFRHGTLRENLY